MYVPELIKNKKHIREVFNIAIQEITKEYLKEAEQIYKEKRILKAIEFFKENKNPELENILKLKEYWDLKYNSQKVDFILSKIDLKEFKDVINTFVYANNGFKREQEKENREQEIINKGYKKISHTQKELNNLKVIGFFYISKIGLMGSFDSLEEKEGKLVYSEYHNALMLIPKRSRTRGYFIRDYAFIKEVEKW